MVDLSADVFAQTSTASGGNKDSSLLSLIEICIKNRLPVPASEQVIRVVLDKCNADLIEDIRKSITRVGHSRGHHAGDFEKMVLRSLTEKDGTQGLMDA